ncbi:unnamed protein product [Lepeophtheirus salmonis]|uniref:(salmon louse) hypothetical protein n=1 Tax=Lepeophtheirus salmonis TaxID=72036 RepID=A0A7R8CHM3_LEPSM|nr:unnamed protein product [Lepeophtheirus salmonis]CAF2792534.1 unnamed protein product [Lepeophtheirus salmonis]
MLRLCFIVLGLSIIVSGKYPCTTPGFFRDPDNCQHFYRCVNWYGNYFTSFAFNCPLGTAFDESISVCNHIGLVSECSKSKPLVVFNPIPTPESSASKPIRKPVTPPFTVPNPPLNTPKPPTLFNPFLTSKRPFTPPHPTTTASTTTSFTTTTSNTPRPFVPLFIDNVDDLTTTQKTVPINEPSTPINSSAYEVDPLSLYACPEPGFYPYERNCNEFYVCQEVLPGILISEQLYSCPKRYLFDEVTSRCQRASKVTCIKFESLSPESDEISAKRGILVVHEQFLDLFFSTPLDYNEHFNR